MWALALLGSFVTAFYMFRLFFVTFKGNFRGTEEQKHHLHESPSSMTIPLMVLAVLSIVGGFIGLPVVFHAPHLLNEFLSPIYEGSRAVYAEFGVIHLSHQTEWILMGVSVAVAVVAIGLSYSIYGNGKNVPVADHEISGIKKVVYDKFYIDEIYETTFVKPIKSFSVWLYHAFDNYVINGLLKGITGFVSESSSWLRRLQTGNIGTYVFLMTLGIIIIVGISVGPEVWASLKSITK